VSSSFVTCQFLMAGQSYWFFSSKVISISLILSIVFLFSIWCIFFSISIFYLASIYSDMLKFLEVGGYVINLRVLYFSRVLAWWYEFTFQHCFWNILLISMCCIFILTTSNISFNLLPLGFPLWTSHGLFRSLFCFQAVEGFHVIFQL
jgi:hypothetical protein